MSRKKVTAIIPAAGHGVRMGSSKKQFLKLDGTPILIHTLRKLVACPEITDIFIATGPEDLAQLQQILRSEELSKRVEVATGGNRRQDSVENCLRALSPDTDMVLVHDAVRPFVSPALVSAVIQEAFQAGASILGVLSVDTVKQVERTRIVSTIPRERIVLAQTPQVFRYEVLKRAFEKAHEDGFQATDEAGLVEHLGMEVTVVKGSDRNIKITQPADLELARFFLEEDRHSLGAPPLRPNEPAGQLQDSPPGTG